MQHFLRLPARGGSLRLRERRQRGRRRGRALQVARVDVQLGEVCGGGAVRWQQRQGRSVVVQGARDIVQGRRTLSIEQPEQGQRIRSAPLLRRFRITYEGNAYIYTSMCVRVCVYIDV